MKKDKILHAIAGLIFSLAIAIPCYCSSYDLFAGLWACLCGVIAGGVKEWCDTQSEGGKWDWSDMAATAIGVVIAVLFILGLHYGRG